MLLDLIALGALGAALVAAAAKAAQTEKARVRVPAKRRDTDQRRRG